MTSINETVRRLRPLPLVHQIAFLRSIIPQYKPRSAIRHEYELMLQDRMTRQIQKQNAQDRKRA